MAEVLIIGGGQIGAYLTALLLQSGHAVTLVETDPANFERLRRTLPPEHLVLGNGTDPDVLESAGIRRADTVVTVTNRDETNLVITSLAKFEFAVPRTIGRVNNPKNAWLYTDDMGVDVALNQADIIGHLVAEEMSLGDMTTLLKLRRGRYALVEEKVHPTSVAVGRALRDLPWPTACVVVAVMRGSELIAPHGDTILHPDDEVLAVLHSDVADEVGALLGAAVERSEES